MALILHLETATKQCSVSLGDAGKQIAVKELAEGSYNHAEKLHLFIEEILKENGVSYQDLQAICVSKGPGSYTGLRIGVSAAKGLAYALDIPLIAINTLEVLARQIKITEGTIIPMIDARRMEVFTAHFDANYDMIKPTYALVLEPNSFENTKGIVYFLGDGASKAQTLFTQDRFVYHKEAIYPSAKDMIEKAFEKYQKNQYEDVAYFEPFYLKDFMLTTSKK